MSQLIKHKLKILSSAALASLLLPLVFIVGSASATAAKCYTQDVNGTGMVPVSCNDLINEDTTANRFKPQDDKCYVASFDANNNITTKEIGCSDPSLSTVNLGGPDGKYTCGGDGQTPIKTSINFGCVGKGNATLDLIFGIVRFLSAGAGIIVVGSLIFAGIQYTTSRGDPNASAAAIKRIQNTAIALLIYIFAFAILNYVVPAGLLH